MRSLFPRTSFPWLNHRRYHAAHAILWLDNNSLPIDLRGIHRKLERAEEHRNLLDRVVQDFLIPDNKAYTFAHEIDMKTGDHVTRVRVLKDPPTTIGPIFGDFLHNIRSALDHAACQFVIHSGGTPTNKTAWPIVNNDPALDKGAKNYWRNATAGMSEEIKTLLDEAQPYKRLYGADYYLIAVLAALSNWDKHHDIHVAGHMLLGSNFTVTGDVGFVITNISPYQPLKDRAEVFRFRLRMPLKMGTKMDMEIEVAFGIAIDNPSQPIMDRVDPCEFAKKMLPDVERIVSVIKDRFPVIE